MPKFVEKSWNERPRPHGYPKARFMPKCTTEYAVRLRQYLPDKIAGGTQEYDQYREAVNLDHARDLADVTARDAARKAPQTKCDVHIVARIVTEWVEIEEDSSAPAAPAS